MKMNHAELVWITPNTEPLIAKMARVSSVNEDNPEYIRLFRYLIKHKHWSPFEMASACIEIRTTRAISAQLIRHRSFSFQEFSQRYATMVTRPMLPMQRLAGATNRQSSKPIEDLTDLTDEQIQAFKLSQECIYNAYDVYTRLIDVGFANETARMILPLCTDSRLYMSGTIRSWLHYLDLRCKDDTQEEHRELAENIKKQLATKIPNIMRLIESQNA